MKNEIFVCKARVVFDQVDVFFRTLSKNMKTGGVGGRAGGVKKVLLFFEDPPFQGSRRKKKYIF